MNRVLISAAHKSSGKTTLTLGLCASFAARGLRVQPFKKGPDYIDPLWLGQAAGWPCHNLDFHTASGEGLLAEFARHATGADLSIIEGNKGLYDGLDIDGGNCNAALAKLLKAPVVLVIDAQGMTRGIAPLILGYQAFDPEVRIAGVILNKLGGSRHESKLRAVIEHYTDIPVLGAVYRQPDLEIIERHLGLMPSNEDRTAAARIQKIARAVEGQVDLDALLAVAGRQPPLTAPVPVRRRAHAGPGVRIAIARDAAFGFYYPGDLEALQRAGAQLVPLDTLKDCRLPAVDGLFIGGGFPETHMAALERNASLRHHIRWSIEAGLPTYAECGGLMYLARSLSWQGRRCEMVGVIPAHAQMHERPQGRGYVRLEETGLGPWGRLIPGRLIPGRLIPGRLIQGRLIQGRLIQGRLIQATATQGRKTEGSIPAHEFHYSSLQDIEGPITYAYKVLRGTGIDGQHDGIVYKNLLAAYAHLRDAEYSPWAERFVDFVRACKARPARMPPSMIHEYAATGFTTT